MKHLHKIEDLINLRKQSIELNKDLTNSVEYHNCDYVVVKRELYKQFLLIQKEPKKQISSGTASEIRRYIKNNNIDHHNIYDAKLIDIAVEKEELLPYIKQTQLLEDSLKLMNQFKDSILMEKCDYLLIKDDYYPYYNYTLVHKDTNIIKQYGTLVQIKKYIERNNIDINKIFQGDVLNVTKTK